MRTQLCQLRDALLLQATDGAPHDGHSDHDAVAFVVRAAGRLIASDRRSRSAIIEMTAYHADGPSLAGLLGGFPTQAERFQRTRSLRMVRIN